MSEKPEYAPQDEVPAEKVASKDVDAALQFLNNESSAPMTPEDERRLLRKIDFRIVPLMCLSLPPRSHHCGIIEEYLTVRQLLVTSCNT